MSSIDYSKNDGFIDSLFLRPPDDVVSFAFFGTWFQSFDTCERKEKKGQCQIVRAHYAWFLRIPNARWQIEPGVLDVWDRRKNFMLLLALFIVDEFVVWGKQVNGLKKFVVFSPILYLISLMCWTDDRSQDSTFRKAFLDIYEKMCVFPTFRRHYRFGALLSIV